MLEYRDGAPVVITYNNWRERLSSLMEHTVRIHNVVKGHPHVHEMYLTLEEDRIKSEGRCPDPCLELLETACLLTNTPFEEYDERQFD